MPGEQRVVLGAQPVHEQRAGGQVAGQALAGRLMPGQPHHGDVGRIVDELEFGVGGRGRDRHRHAVLTAQAEGLRQFHGQPQAQRRHRVTGAEVVACQPVIPGHVQRAGHREASSRLACQRRW